MSFKLNYLNKENTFNNKVRIFDLIKDKDHRYICAKVNNSIRELSYFVNYNAKIEFLTLKDMDAIDTYRRSLCYLVSMAFYKLYPSISLRFTYSVSRAMYLEDTLGKEITPIMINRVIEEMEKLISNDIPFKRLKMNNKKAALIYLDMELFDKLQILAYRPESTSHLYKCNNYFNYFYGRMVYSTGYIKYYKFRKSDKGYILQYPRAEDNGKIPLFENAPAYLRSLKSSESWAKEMKCRTIREINNKIVNESSTIDFINECEARHSRMLVELGNNIERNIDRLKLICIAGPSSSGKTTFANRLRVELLSRGIKPTMISLDNYYLPLNKIPKDEKGDLDFECIEALDIALFNSQMSDLIKGKTVNIPIYNFCKAGENKTKKLHLDFSDKQIIIIEGIHALNEKVTSKINRENKYKIYISPQIQVNIDNVNPLSLTDLRLLRRITRDYLFRNISALKTIKMWPSVRAGEFKWIYKGIEESDYVFNSFSFFELCAYKKHTQPLLMKIKRSEPLFPIAERLLRMLKFFSPIEDKWIPCNSLIREFIGGSCFE